MKRFEALDGFRGICAMLVVMYHMHILNSFTQAQFLRNGFYFVEFFFVLSGFVLYHTYGNKTFNKQSFKRFFISRTFRIFPLHIVMLIVFILFEFGKLLAEKKGFVFNNHAFQGSYAVNEIVPNLLLLQAWLKNAQVLSFNTASWSISVEYYMYLIFGAILFLPKQKNYIYGSIALFAFIAVYINSDILKGEALRGLTCFFSGCLSYLIYSKISILKFTKKPFHALELISLLIMIFIIMSNLEYKSIYITISFCLVVIIFSFEEGIVSKLLKSKPISRLGKLSYSIYITHLAILFVVLSSIMVIGKVIGKDISPMILDSTTQKMERTISTGNALTDNLLVLLIFGVIIFISELTYKYIELKGISYGKSLNEDLSLVLEKTQ